MPFDVPPYLVEIPALYVDGLVLDDSSVRPLLMNRMPEPNETGIELDDIIFLEITDTGADGIDTAATKIYVDGVLAYDGGLFQVGFTGPSSDSTNPFADTLQVVIDPLSDFESLQVVEVRVVSATVGGAFHLDQSYSFTCEDLTPPVLLAASQTDQKILRVSFDEPVRMVSSLATDDALNPSNYSIALTLGSTPAVELEVVSVSVVSDTVVELLFDIEATPGGEYSVTAENIEDVIGNVITAPYNSVGFTGYQPDVPATRNFQLIDFVPVMNVQEDVVEDLIKFIACLQEVTDLLLVDVDRWTRILDPDLADEQYVDAMLYDLGNPFDFDLSLNDKRRLLLVLVQIYKLKGTSVGLVDVVRFFLDLEVSTLSYSGEGPGLGDAYLGDDWVLGPSTRWAIYSFEIVSPVVLTADQRSKITTLANYMKPGHTHLAKIVEPTTPDSVDHVELGMSELGDTFTLH